MKQNQQRVQPSERRGDFGFIHEVDFGRHELHGFEVDLTGHVIVPELCPKFQIVIRPHQEANRAREILTCSTR
jgi:hypothetical protein